VLRAWLDAEPAAEEARLALARSLLALGRTEEAVAMIEAAIAAGPVDPRLRELLVHALRRLKRTNAAIIAARDLTAAAPRQVSAHLLLGETLLWARRLDPARAAFERALRLDPGLRRARLGLALAAEEGGEEPGPALRAAIEGLAAEGAPEEEWLWLVRMLEPLRRPGAAAFAAAQAVKAWPQSLALQEALGAARLAAGDLDGAAQAYRVVAQGRPERVEGWLGLTDALWRAKRFAEGVEVLRAAVARHPDHAVLAVRAASFLLAAGRPEAALREARRAVALDPRLEIAHMTLAEVLHRLHRTGEMIRALEAALEVLPDSAAIAARLGHVQALAEMPARAAESFARAVAAPRAPLHAWVGLVDALLRLDRRAEAEAAARRGLAAYPAARELQARLGQILLDAGDAGAARDALAEALAADQGSETVHLAMADALLRQGRRAEAIAAAREAVAVSGGRPDVAARLGHLLIEAGEIEEAAAIFTRVTAEAPELVTGWVGLSDAERLRKRFREAVAACRRAEAAGADRHTLRMLRFRLYGEMEE
jgi:tetratricopeptide (TPR) repeat protein